MHHGPLDALERGEGFFNEVRSRLHQHLHGDILGDAILFNKLAQKGEVVA